MKKATVNGVGIEYQDSGEGEPLLMIHGAMIAATFEGMAEEPALARYRKIRIHRRGYAGSEHPEGMSTFPIQAQDAVGLLRHLGIPRAHLVGHSYGGLISLRAALDSPDAVQSLSLLEPPLLGSPFAAPFFEFAATHLFAPYGEGKVAEACETFLDAVGGAGARARCEQAIPGAWETLLGDARTLFEREFPCATEGLFLESDAPRVKQPAISVVGAKSEPIFQASHQALLGCLPDVKSAVIPNATHFLQVEEPRAVAEAVAGFVSRHPIR